MAARVDYSDASKSSLLRSHEAFSSGNSQIGFMEFRSVPQTYQNKVYEQIWINRNKPQGNPEYGRQVFHDTDGLFSTAQEKARALDPLVNQIRESNMTGAYGGYGYRYERGNYRTTYVPNLPNYNYEKQPVPTQTPKTLSNKDLKNFGEAVDVIRPAHISQTASVAIIVSTYVISTIIVIAAAFKR